MSIELIALGLAALASGIASGAIHELAGKRWAVTWSLVMVFLLMVLYVL